MIMPPRVAPVQAVIIPVIRDEEGRAALLDYCSDIAAKLKAQGIRVKLDDGDERTPDKMWAAIKKGIPLRIEAGPREMENGEVTHVRRDLGRESKQTCSVENLVKDMPAMLEDMQRTMLEKARGFLSAHVKDAASVADADALYAGGHTGFVRLPIAVLDDPEYAALKDQYKLTSRCLPFADEGRTVIAGKAY
jgi:prolyl-tRNA synthetase